MEFFDKNETMQAPRGFTFSGLRAEGSFLVVRYFKFLADRSTSHIVIYLNDQGREVGRTWETLPNDPDTDTVIDWSGASAFHLKDEPIEHHVPPVAPNKFVAWWRLWWTCLRKEFFNSWTWKCGDRFDHIGDDNEPKN